MNFSYRDIGGSFGSEPAPETSGYDSADGVGASLQPALQLSVRRARGLRDVRKKLLGAECSSGPGWEVLLYMFESHVMQRRDTIGNVCDGTDIPATTALRWINRLAELGLITLWDDHLDSRRRFAALSATGVHTMTEYFTGIAPHPLAA